MIDSWRGACEQGFTDADEGRARGEGFRKTADERAILQAVNDARDALAQESGAAPKRWGGCAESRPRPARR